MRRITILGKGNGWNKVSDWECWAVVSALPNMILALRKSVSRSFDVHSTTILPNIPEEKQLAVDKRRIVWNKIVNENKIYHYTCEVDPAIPTSIRYPLEELVDHFQTDYFTNTVTYMLALAIYEGIDAIDLYGVNMTLGTEYENEKGGVEYWIGRAQGQGIKVKVHGKESELFKVNGFYGHGKLYGYGTKQMETT